MYTLAGGLWCLVGAFLMFRGAHMFQLAMAEQQSTLQAVLVSALAGLVIGGIKGKFVLVKTARRNITRIGNLDGPLKLHQIFSTGFYALIAGMIALGVTLRTFNEYLGGYVVVAAIYCGIGMALIVASLVYWKTESPVQEKT